MNTSNFVAYTKFADLEKYADEYCIDKAPFQLPEGLKEFLVKFGPYAMIVFLVLGLLSYFSIYRYGAMYGMMGYFWTPMMSVSLVVSLVAFGLQIKALPWLLARKKEGWEYMVYASLVSLVANLINFEIIGFVLGFVISMYILFQLKYMYK